MDVAVIVPEELLEQARLTRLMFMVLMGLIAAISLVVGGIGIMNIMLATVTERTREIGIRRALGATRMHIIMQFLVETILLSVVGGLTGILAGLICPLIITSIRDLMYSYAPNLMQDLPGNRSARSAADRARLAATRVRNFRRRRRRVRPLSGLSRRPNGSDRSPAARVNVPFPVRFAHAGTPPQH